MTSEVAVLNRLAVALASDSAASVYVNGRTKLYHADKLFMLSNCRPVGVMVNNSSSLLNVPWETLIKVFREELGHESFDRLEGYTDRFIKFLEGEGAREFFPKQIQDDIFIASLKNYFKEIEEEAFYEAIHILREQGIRKRAQITKEALNVVIQRHVSDWEKLPVHPRMYEGMGAKYVTELSGRVNSEAIHEVFQKQDAAEQEVLNRLSQLVVERQGVLSEMFSNVVIAGFGDKDMFPVLQELEISGIFSNKLKWRDKEAVVRISGKRPAAIRAFAQSEVAETFLYGANPSFYTYLTDSFAEFLMKQVRGIIDDFPRVAKKRREEYKGAVVEQLMDSTVELLRMFNKHRQEKFYLPIEQSIAHLPKNEIAQVASTLVNLNSFQKRVSMIEDETVGGPVDVAVITRGDGFVWVERKHYFKPELNSHFFNNRLKLRDADSTPGTKVADNKETVPQSQGGNLTEGAK